jgi:hypothetical protein
VAEITLATCRTKPGLTASDRFLAEALERRGATVQVCPWDAIIPGEISGRVCLRSTWDYHLRSGEFLGWVADFDGHRGALWNPPALVQWNADKLYLRELERSGIAIPATIWIDPHARPDLESLLTARGWPQGVLKPRVSATAHGTHLVSASDRLGDAEWETLAPGGALLQQFLPEIRTAGEVSLVFLAGRLSHAARKLPGQGDFRVQSDFGGSAIRIRPSPSLRRFGDRVMACVGSPWLYARVDLVETIAGPVLMELELIEPDLFFNLAPPSADLLATALLDGAGS